MEDVSSAEDIINIEGTMRFFEAIGLDPEEPAVLAVAYHLDAPSLGVLSRSGFVEGWRTYGYSPTYCCGVASVADHVAVTTFPRWRVM